MSFRRALHFVFKVANRTKTIEFYRNVLKMKCLRHEEFEEGCKASCNGPYDGKWSKTMMGYGAEDDNFVVELTYNYGIKEYKHGNDYNYLEIFSNEVLENVKKLNYSHSCLEDGKSIELSDPDGYKFLIRFNANETKVTKISLFSSNLDETIKYWHNLLGMDLLNRSDNLIELSYAAKDFKLEFKKCLQEKIDHEQAFGRIAFSCTTQELEKIQEKIDENKYNVLTRLVSLDTPGKATVHVVILADPDGHEICFVGDEGFRDLSKVDPNADKLLDDAITNDKSEEWYKKHNKK